jgi:integrase
MIDYRTAVADYVTTRRAMGYKFGYPGQMLEQFAAYLNAAGAEHLTIDHALSWATQPRGTRHSWWAIRLTMVRGFARYLRALDPATEIPPAGLIRAQKPRAVPYIYTEDDIAALLSAADRLPTAHRADTFHTLIGLVAVTGMRGGEAVRLDRDDVDLDEGLLTIRDSKFGKSRQIPTHPSTVEALAGYAQRRDARRPRPDGRRNRHAPSSTSFFTSTTGTRLLRDNVSATFPRLVYEAGLDWSGHPRRPRLQDLRHCFAVNTVIGWYRAGLDVEQRLPLLSTYLGHLTPKSTYWYLSAVPELLELVTDRLDTIIEVIEP